MPVVGAKDVSTINRGHTSQQEGYAHHPELEQSTTDPGNLRPGHAEIARHRERLWDVLHCLGRDRERSSKRIDMSGGRVTESFASPRWYYPSYLRTELGQRFGTRRG